MIGNWDVAWSFRRHSLSQLQLPCRRSAHLSFTFSLSPSVLTCIKWRDEMNLEFRESCLYVTYLYLCSGIFLLQFRHFPINDTLLRKLGSIIRCRIVAKYSLNLLEDVFLRRCKDERQLRSDWDWSVSYVLSRSCGLLNKFKSRVLVGFGTKYRVRNR